MTHGWLGAPTSEIEVELTVAEPRLPALFSVAVTIRFSAVGTAKVTVNPVSLLLHPEPQTLTLGHSFLVDRYYPFLLRGHRPAGSCASFFLFFSVGVSS